MSVINIDQPNYANIDNSLNEQQCDELINGITSIIESKSMTSALLELDLKNSVFAGAGSSIASGAAPTMVTLEYMKKYIKNKYGLCVKRIIAQSKDLNDLYTKVNDILTHDKWARFKHRNDIIDADQKFVRLQDSKNPRQIYQITYDMMAYNIDYLINEINDIMNYANHNSVDRDTDLKNMKDSLIETIDKDFEQNHWFIERLVPVIKTESYHSVKLGKVLKVYRDVFSGLYNNIYFFNKIVDNELKYVQLTEQAYNRMMNVWGKDKDGKIIVEEVFKKILKNMAMSMEFNSKLMELSEEVIKFYAEEIEKVYNIIRS